MSRSLGKSLTRYAGLLNDVKQRIRHAQNRAAQAVNTELVRLYWDIGRLILARQKAEGWGTGVIPRLARDLHNELPEVKGFSERNIMLMMQFANEYPNLFSIAQPPVAQLPWAHNILLIRAVKDRPTRLWYMQQTLQHGWSRNVLSLMIANQSHLRQGKAITNFPQLLPPAQSDLAIQLLKDPYIFDFLTLAEPFHERELETGLLQLLQKFLLELGRGFAFVGRQYRIEVDGKDFYIDLLFYHLFLRCYFVIDLKTGDFKAEYAGKMNFYLNVLDDRLRHPSDAPSIGLILCQKRNRVIAKYALRGIKKPIGISQYELTRALPAQLRSSLPTVEQIEAELTSPQKSQPPTTRSSQKSKRSRSKTKPVTKKRKKR